MAGVGEGGEERLEKVAGEGKGGEGGRGGEREVESSD